MSRSGTAGPEIGLRIGSPSRWGAPSYDTVAQAVRAVAATGVKSVPLSGPVGRVLNRVGRFPRRDRPVVITPVMGQSWQSVAAATLWGRPLLLAWDVWEHDIDRWVWAIRRFHCVGFISTSAQAASLVRDALPGLPVESIPEAVRVSKYFSRRPLTERTNGVLELGRRHEGWHEDVVDVMARNKVSHLYEQEKGRLVFPTDREMVAGLQNAAISVCFPRSMTHPESAGGVETMTQRYLESMAAGCLLLGHAPAEMVEFFGYNPVVEADEARSSEQLTEILSDLRSFQSLVDRNRDAVTAAGDWDARAAEIVSISRHIASNAF